MADEEVRFATQGVEHAGHFDRNIPSTDKGNFLRLRLKLEEAVGGDAEVTTGDVFGNVRVPAGSDEDVFGIDISFGAVV